MNIKEKILDIAYLIVIIIYTITICILIQQNNSNEKQIIELTKKLKQYENINVPSKEETDSIKVNIHYKDSIIKFIKTEYIKDVEWVKNMPDSAAVALFHQLVWANTNTD